MKKLEIEVYSEASNSAVVRMPGRRFPGVVLQGDSLSILLDEALCVLKHIKPSGDDDDPYHDILSIARKLRGHLLNYEAALKAHGFQLPYGVSVDNVELPEFPGFDG